MYKKCIHSYAYNQCMLTTKSVTAQIVNSNASGFLINLFRFEYCNNMYHMVNNRKITGR